MNENEIKAPETQELDAHTEGTAKKYTAEELLERRRKERKAAERRARAERDRYYAFYDDVKTDEDPSW